MKNNLKWGIINLGKDVKRGLFHEILDEVESACF